MPNETITLPLDPEAAKAYKAAAPEDQKKMQVLVSLWLRELATTEPPDLKKMMDEASQKARARGLTPKILESLLKGA